MTLAFPKEYFNLFFSFARRITIVHQMPFESVIFRYTPLYARLLGFDDSRLPEESDPAWQEIITSLPPKHTEQVAYTFDRYQRNEANKKNDTSIQWFGCFRYTYHERENCFELHFGNNDPLGNLSTDRRNIRRAELTQLFSSLKKENKQNASVHLRSWLFHTDAITALFPPQFVSEAISDTRDLAQDNANWGQFVDIHGNFKHILAQQLLHNTNMRREHINDYFPLPAKMSTVHQDVFFQHFTV